MNLSKIFKSKYFWISLILYLALMIYIFLTTKVVVNGALFPQWRSGLIGLILSNAIISFAAISAWIATLFIKIIFEYIKLIIKYFKNDKKNT